MRERVLNWLIENAYLIAAFGAAIALAASVLGQYGEKMQAEETLGYLRGDNSHIYLAYDELNEADQHTKLIQVGPNPVWDITVQAYPVSGLSKRDDLSLAEQASNYFRFDDTVLHPGRVSKLVKFPSPDAEDPNTWDHYVELFMRTGTQSQLLLLDHTDGVWTQGFIVYFAKKDGRAEIVERNFDAGFPAARRERAEGIVADIIETAKNAASAP